MQAWRGQKKSWITSPEKTKRKMGRENMKKPKRVVFFSKVGKLNNDVRYIYIYV